MGKTYRSLEEARKDFIPKKPKDIFDPKPCPRCKDIGMIFVPSWLGGVGYWRCPACNYTEQAVDNGH